EIDEQGLEVRALIVPSETGEELSAESLLVALDKKRVREGIDTEAIEKAFRTLTRKKGEPVTFVAAAGAPPRPPEPESVDFETLPIPPRLQKIAEAVLARAPSPVGFRVREERVKKEKKVLKKSALSFLPAQEEVQVVVEKRLVREVVPIDPAVTATGFVQKGSLVAKIRPGRPGKEGKSVFGRLVPAPRVEPHAFLFCEGLARTGSDVRATTGGFLRKGANWCDVVAFRDHVVDVTASPDGATCLLSFEPGDAAVPEPTAEDIIARAVKLGFSPAGLISPAEITALVHETVASNAPFTKKSLTPSADGLVAVTVSPDKLTATLTLRKGRGGGRPLTLAGVSDAIRLSKVRGYSAETVRRDIQAFFKGAETELADYPLAAGKAPAKGKDGGVEWLVKFLPSEEAERIRAFSAASAASLSGIASLKEFPLESVETVGGVTAETAVLRIVPGTPGPSGVDVFGAVVPGLRGATPEVRVFEGLQQRRETVVAVEEGLLEKGSRGMDILLRVRPHRDAELRITISDDRMKGFLAFTPSRGTGWPVEVQEVRSKIEEAGIARGLDEGRLDKALESIAQGKAFPDTLIAQGRKPEPGKENLVTFHIHLATGKAVTLREDGTADFRAQDRITRVGKGIHLATVRPPPLEGLESWDVTGRPIPPPPGALNSLQAGRGVSAVRQQDGSVKYYAQTDGELVRDGTLISVQQVHTVAGDVDMGSGNVNFPGIVRVNGSVQAGFRILAAGDIEIEETVEAAVLSSEGSILIGQGIKGDGKAILRAKKTIMAPFAEQAVLLATENVHLKGACLRCRVKCNGKLLLDSEKGSLVGGEVKARQGIVVQNLGSPAGTHTLVWFGQDFMLKDQIDREEGELATFAKRVAEIDAEMKNFQKEALAGRPTDREALSHMRTEKAQLLNAIEQRKQNLAGLNETFNTHCPSEILVRGTLFPGVVIESHGKRWETRTEKNMITLMYDQGEGKITEKR
ncbi:MAG: flagellar assembly protein A, partial [Spirochaetia bacterium]